MISRKKSRQTRLLAVFLIVLFFLPVKVNCQPVHVNPLFDTFDNRAYYDNLMSSIRKAETSIKVLMATANFYPEYPEGLQRDLFDVLSAASARQVEVKVILDESEWSEDITQTNLESGKYLEDRDVDVKYYDPEVTNHAKLVIVDDEIALLGSSNWNYETYTESYECNVLIENEKVAQFYGSFFAELWEGGEVRGVSPPGYSPEPAVVPLVSANDQRAYYQEVLEMLKNAEDSIELAIFKITRYPGFSESKSNLLLEELVEAFVRGVEVRIILDVNTWSEEINRSNRETALWLLGQGVKDVSFADPQTTTHGKFLIVDGRSVVVGSTNWSYYSLAENLEADISFRNLPSMGETFQIFFEKLWEESEIPSRDELSGVI